MPKHRPSTLLLLAFAALSSAALAQDKPTLGVAEFDNNVGSLYWWNSGVGTDLSDMLTNELAATNAFTIVERANLEPVLREQDLAQAGRVSSDTAARVGELTGAQYLVQGTVSAYEESKSTGGGIGFRGIRVGGKKDEAYIAVDLRVIDTTTGQVSYTRTVEAHAGGRGFDIGAYHGGWSGNLSQYEATPAGKAIRAILVEITDYLECAMVTQGSCLAEYEAKENRRREGLKDSIKID
ncbi:MAG: CsgG/HfaB family protein [Thermoanaerobaculia bacterium]